PLWVTFAVQKVMSALPQKRTFGSAKQISAIGQKRPLRKSTEGDKASWLAELDDDGLSVGALHALECALVLVQGLGRLDLRKKHRQSAFRASPLTDWRLGQVEILRLRHRSKPLNSHNASHVVAPTPLDEVGAPFVTKPWDGRRPFSMSAPVHYSLE